jgi:hypothetical protein
MSYSPLANISPADISAFKNYQSLPSEQQGAKLQDMIGNGFDWGKLIALKNQADKIKAKEQADMVAYQAQQAGGAPPPMGQNSTVADDLQAQIRAALYPQQQQQMPPQMAQGQMPPQEQMPPQQMAQAQMPTQQMAHGGLAHLPVTNFRDENYAGGGIVAFNGEKNKQLVEESDAYAEAMRENPLSQGIGNQLVPEVKNLRRGFNMIGDRIGSEVADVVAMPGQIAYDWDHYNRTKAASKDDTGKLLPKYKTQGFMPITADLADRQAAARDFPDSPQRSVPNVMGVPTKLATKVAAPTSGPKFDAFAGAFPGAARMVSSSAATNNPEELKTISQLPKDSAAKDITIAEGSGEVPNLLKSGIALGTPEARATERARRLGIGTGTGTGTRQTAEEDNIVTTANKMLERSDKLLDASMKERTPAEQDRLDTAAGEKVQRKHDEALVKAGLSPKAYEDSIRELKDQAVTARKNRDTDHLMAAAAGFFAMAGGTSPYALKNMADGFGVSVKNVMEAEKTYRASEKDRQTSLTAYKQAQRAEVLGLEDKKAAFILEGKKAEERVKANQMKFGELLGIRAVEALSRRQTSKDAQAARIQAAEIAAGARTDAEALRAAVRETPQQQLMKEYTAAVESGDPKQIEAVKAKVEFFQSTNPGFARTDQAAAAVELKSMLGSKTFENYQMLKSIPNPSQTHKDQIAAKELELKAQFPNAFKGGAAASAGGGGWGTLNVRTP